MMAGARWAGESGYGCHMPASNVRHLSTTPSVRERENGEKELRSRRLSKRDESDSLSGVGTASRQR